VAGRGSLNFGVAEGRREGCKKRRTTMMYRVDGGDMRELGKTMYWG